MSPTEHNFFDNAQPAARFALTMLIDAPFALTGPRA
jgi:hypothetical protein